VVATDDDAAAGALLRHEREGRLEAAATEREKARRVDGVSDQEDGEPERRHRTPPATRPQLRSEEPCEQDQEERDADQEVAEVDHLRAQERQDRRGGEQDRDEPQEPEVVPLAREADEPEGEQRRSERGVEGSQRVANGEPEREAQDARDDLARHGGGATAHAHVAQIDDGEGREPDGRRRMQAERIADAERARTGRPREAQRRQCESAAPEEDEEELREHPEAGGGGEERRRPIAAALEEAQQGEQRGQREEDLERVAARLGGEVHEGEARGAQRSGKHRLQAPAPRPEERREDEAPGARQERRKTVDGPLALVSEPVEEERVQVVVVRGVELREDAERGVEPARIRPGPDLIQPQIAPAGDRAHHGPGEDAGGDGEPRRAALHRRLPQISTRGACTAVRKRWRVGSSRFSKGVSG
jgi:hypothetical protein